MTAPTPPSGPPGADRAISHVAWLLRLSYQDELTDDVRDQMREHCVACVAAFDAARARIAELERERDQAKAAAWDEGALHALETLKANQPIDDNPYRSKP